MDKGKPDTFYDKNETDKKLNPCFFLFCRKFEVRKYSLILYWLV